MDPHLHTLEASELLMIMSHELSTATNPHSLKSEASVLLIILIAELYAANGSTFAEVRSQQVVDNHDHEALHGQLSRIC